MESAFYIVIDPIILKIGPLTLSWYGLMVVLGIVTVVAWLVWQNSKSHQLSKDAVFNAAAVGIPSGIIFSKVLHLIDQFDFYTHNPGRIFSGEGLTIWGGVLGAAIGIWIFSKVSHQFRFAVLGDIIAPGIILSQAVGRVGCTINGCCYGVESHSPLAVVYTNLHSYGPLGIPVLPTQVFEIIYDLAVFGILVALKDRLKPQGALFVVYLALYSAWRFGIDFFRVGAPFLFGLHQAQFIGLVILAAAIPYIIMRVRWDKKEEVLKAEAEA